MLGQVVSQALTGLAAHFSHKWTERRYGAVLKEGKQKKRKDWKKKKKEQ